MGHCARWHAASGHRDIDAFSARQPPTHPMKSAIGGLQGILMTTINRWLALNPWLRDSSGSSTKEWCTVTNGSSMKLVSPISPGRCFATKAARSIRTSCSHSSVITENVGWWKASEVILFSSVSVHTIYLLLSRFASPVRQVRLIVTLYAWRRCAMLCFVIKRYEPSKRSYLRA